MDVAITKAFIICAADLKVQAFTPEAKKKSYKKIYRV